ncbi:MAG: hypothetical protein P8L18_15920 [Verrucomicrobiota bacterium]|nr:hypothetical protein [Verrucomicrobiota bacterium]
MNKTRSNRRTAGRWSLAIGIFGVALFPLFLTTMDDTPYMSSDYYRQSLESLERSKDSMPLATTELQIGTARLSITPMLEMHGQGDAQTGFPEITLAGYGARKGAPAEGVLEPLYIKALWMKSGDLEGAIISMDLLIPPDDMVQAFRMEAKARFNLPSEHFHFSATHTHSSLGGWAKGLVGEIFAGPHQPGLNAWLKTRVFEVLENARQSLRNARVAYAENPIPTWTRNRLVGNKGELDPMLQSIFLKPEGAPVVTLGAYSAHATVMGADSMQFCGDYPGHWEQKVEQTTGGFAMFLAGGMGSHAPNVTSKDHQAVDHMADALASVTINQLEHAVFDTVSILRLGWLQIQLPELHLRLTSHLRLRPWLGQKLIPNPGVSYLGGIRLGNILLLNTPCDFSGELAKSIRNDFAAMGVQAALSSFNGSYIGYVVPQKYYYLNHYETRTMSFYGPNTGPYLEEMIKRLGKAMLEPDAG